MFVTASLTALCFQEVLVLELYSKTSETLITFLFHSCGKCLSVNCDLAANEIYNNIEYV
jgi:hypothetical protein